MFEFKWKKRGKAPSHIRPHQEVVTRSQLTHIGVSFTNLRQINSKEIYKLLFLDKTQRATPVSAKYFYLKNAWTVVGIQNAALMHC